MRVKKNQIGVGGSRVSREGYEFDTRSQVWKLSRDVALEISSYRDLISSNLFEGFIAALADTATTHSAKHTSNMYFAFFRMIRTIGLNAKVVTLTATDFINFKATLTIRTEWHLGRLVGFIKKWSASGHPGIAQEVLPLFDGWRLSGNPKGEAVRLRSPLSGPLTTMEFELFQARLLDSFEDQNITLEEYALAVLFSATGRRPAQLADGKWGDLEDSMDPSMPALLSVARRKGEGSAWRTQFKDVALTPEIALTFRTLKEKSLDKVRTMLPNLSEQNFNKLPIFVRWGKLKKFRDSSAQVLDAVVVGEEFHCQSQYLGHRLTTIIDSLSVQSDRIPDRIHVTATRLRRTLASRASREGLSTLIIAELLDHTDTQNAGVYTENVPENVDPINDAVANQIAPIMKAFAGEIIESEKFAARAADSSSRIRTEKGSKAGNCGHCGTCVARAPIACYTCRAFQPWIDGDHQAVLSQLLKERESCSDPRIAEVCDLSIFAVREVITLCELKKSQSQMLREEGQ